MEAYLAGITGELAEQLTEGKPCPVCGSISHPHKAIKVDNSITKVMVDAKKKEADKKYAELQTQLKEQTDAKNNFDKKETLFSRYFKNTILKLLKISRMHLRIYSVELLGK